MVGILVLVSALAKQLRLVGMSVALQVCIRWSLTQGIQITTHCTNKNSMVLYDRFTATKIISNLFCHVLSNSC